MKPRIRKVGYFWYVYAPDWVGGSISWRGALEIAAIHIMRRGR